MLKAKGVQSVLKSKGVQYVLKSKVVQIYTFSGFILALTIYIPCIRMCMRMKHQQRFEKQTTLFFWKKHPIKPCGVWTGLIIGTALSSVTLHRGPRQTVLQQAPNGSGCDRATVAGVSRLADENQLTWPHVLAIRSTLLTGQLVCFSKPLPMFSQAWGLEPAF